MGRVHSVSPVSHVSRVKRKRIAPCTVLFPGHILSACFPSLFVVPVHARKGSYHRYSRSNVGDPNVCVWEQHRFRRSRCLIPISSALSMLQCVWGSRTLSGRESPHRVYTIPYIFPP